MVTKSRGLTAISGGSPLQDKLSGPRPGGSSPPSRPPPGAGAAIGPQSPNQALPVPPQGRLPPALPHQPPRQRCRWLCPAPCCWSLPCLSQQCLLKGETVSKPCCQRPLRGAKTNHSVHPLIFHLLFCELYGARRKTSHSPSLCCCCLR